MEQNRELRYRPSEYAQLIFEEGMKTIEWRIDSFSTNGAGAIEPL